MDDRQQETICWIRPPYRTLLNRGAVYVVDRTIVPSLGRLAAVLRFKGAKETCYGKCSKCCSGCIG